MNSKGFTKQFYRRLVIGIIILLIYWGVTIIHPSKTIMLSINIPVTIIAFTVAAIGIIDYKGKWKLTNWLWSKNELDNIFYE